MIKLFFLKESLWKKYNPILNEINHLESELQQLSEGELKEKTLKLKGLVSTKSTKIDSKIIIDSFSLVREASRRTLGLRHYDTQLLGGLLLHDKKIAEMRTGEGKTLVAIAPAFANALEGKGVHIVTVNEYLAKRDAEWMGQIYRYLGLNVGLVLSGMNSLERRRNYNRDVTYITNNTLGFDYLRDNLVTNVNDLVQRPLHFCILDEVDSILIDEARTPLIISQPSQINLQKIIKSEEVVKYLREVQDYEVDKKQKSISLTSQGLTKVQKLLRSKDLYEIRNPWVPFILNALKAKALFLRDIHYIVEDETVVIVDEFTGRIMEDCQWGEGLHNAVEAKEKIYNSVGSATKASITYQNFFRLYPKIAGMTGTAKTEELEFEKIYNLSVSVLPTFKPTQRLDLPDSIYIDELHKWKAVAYECEKMYLLQRPVLVGTTTIQNSQFLSILLRNLKVPFQLLNARPENIMRESEIIAQAGCLGSVTIATNMAGRGTDVLLGGNPEFKASRETIFILESVIANQNLNLPKESLPFVQELKEYRHLLISLQQDFNTLLNLINIPNKTLNSLESLLLKVYKRILKKYQFEAKEEREKILKLGGLYVIGTERHESRRIDNQLRGRAGRQGDPGTSRFFLSLNDSLLAIFGGDRIKNLMQALQIDENEALESSFISQALDRAQQKVEGFYYEQRKSLNKYDRVLNKQRLIFYQFRKNVLVSNNIRDLILEFGEETIDDFIYFSKKNNKFSSYFLHFLNLSIEINKNPNLTDLEHFKDLLYEEFWSKYGLKEIFFKCFDNSLSLFKEYQTLLVLNQLDFYWSKHLEDIDYLRDAVSWEAYAQKDPFLKYEEEAYRLFNQSFKECRIKILYNLFNDDLF